MTTTPKLIIAKLLTLGLLLLASSSFADSYSAAITEFKSSPAVQDALAKSYGYALFPTIGKGGIGVGGAHGKGKVYRAGQVTGSTSMTQITIGFQLGGQAYSQLICFKDKRAYERFTSGKFEFGAQATAVAITASANAQASTTGNSASATSKSDAGAQAAEFVNGMAVFTYAKGGLMYEASLGGQKFSYKAAGAK
ncbi:Las17-binding protein actin regulator [Alteromonadaceae bacterium 2753L.S.0a.02]|nr:Las17-binding protein actin regulator [Alteromonadaceae bacterium 2753L.S.0a.02]